MEYAPSAPYERRYHLKITAALIVRKALWFSGPRQQQQQQQQQAFSSGAVPGGRDDSTDDDDNIDFAAVDAAVAEHHRRKSAAAELAADEVDLSAKEVAMEAALAAGSRLAVTKPPLRGVATQWLGKAGEALPSCIGQMISPGAQLTSTFAPNDNGGQRVEAAVLDSSIVAPSGDVLRQQTFVGAKRPATYPFGAAKRKPTSLQ